MDGANADSDHSMTWEDFFGSTTDLAPTLIGIYDSLLEPAKSQPELSRYDATAKDARNDPPLGTPEQKNMDDKTEHHPSKNSNVQLSTVNKSSLYSLRTNVTSASDNIGANETISRVNYNSSDTSIINKNSLYKVAHDKKTDVDVGTINTFENLSPNVKRMISSANETTKTLKIQKKSIQLGRNSVRGHKTNIPLVGATSKISQSGVEILPSVEIYDQPCVLKSKLKEQTNAEVNPPKAEFKLNSDVTYDVPKKRNVIYDVPTLNTKTAFESLSLPFIDQSIELTITTNDREFDTKLSSKENSPNQPKTSTPEKNLNSTVLNGCTNSLHRKDFNTRSDSPSKQLSKSSPYPDTTASTGNLKFERVPPTVEVSRPLSMSSIASSSSTSSSGVQNKGGVNSAYLASIESLDDHSDADIQSGNGSNIYVNNAGVLNNNISEERCLSNDLRDRPIEELPGLTQLERVCTEIVQTENVYVEDLRQVVEGYLHVWRTGGVFSEDELGDLFNNIEDIYTFNRSLCEELNTCRLDAISIARCFVNNILGFSVYTSYCTGYPRTMERLAELASRPQSAKAFRERQAALHHPLPLASYLLKPVQRILKYHLLLQNLVKNCASRDTEYALLKMTGIAQHIDDMKRRHEHAVRVQEIQSLLYGWNGPDLTTYGELCAEGTFRVFGAKAMRHAFLFDKMLLITKNREDGVLAYKSHIMCNNLMLVESIAGAPLSFHVIPWDAPRHQLTLQARSPRHKREWTLLLKRVILENYNAVIPSHARQLVMELGQNKTDDDILAEKSHNLITQASMRKQLSAPEYLEKRKLERERRKSFENGIRGRFKKANRKYTVPNSRTETPQECDCAQVYGENGTDYTCENCYIDLCSDCEAELNKNKKEDKCTCRNDDTSEKCPECDRSLHFIDSGSEILERKSCCKCSDFGSSQESVNREFTNTLNKTRGYHSTDNIVNYTDDSSKEDLSINSRNVPRTCLKCAKIKENIVVSESSNKPNTRKSRCHEFEKHTDNTRSKSKDDLQRSKLSKIGTWRRKSEPGLQQNVSVPKRVDNDDGNEKIEFECKNCGCNRITKKLKNNGVIISDPELDTLRKKQNLEVKMYNSKNIPKKISKLKKNRTKGLRLGSDKTAKFYADISTDISTENILHISESNDSINTDNTVRKINDVSKDEDIDEETYKKLIEKTDSFKKNELEKVKFLNKHKVINENTEVETDDKLKTEEIEQPLEQIISQLLMQNREFQKLLKKQQLRNSAQRRHQRLLKSNSNPEPVTIRNQQKLKPKYNRQLSELILNRNEVEIEIHAQENDDDHIYETLRVENKTNNQVIETKRATNTESDYVYLTFDQSKPEDEIYDVPVNLPQKSEDIKPTDYYVPIESKTDPEVLYDKVEDVYRRKNSASTGEYLPMTAEIKSPNTPEIWISRQKDHFNIPRDRKSGSLPRSFQVVANIEDRENLSTFKSNSKTYLNKDGKVLNIERPFTIASDKSDISYDDISDGEILKFNKSTPSNESISRSTLELEEEIDRCYRNFEKINLDANNANTLTESQQNLNTSTTSSCEVLTPDENKEMLLPEHKIYKPTTNILSIKNVLSRFKNKNQKNEEEINANDAEVKNEKRPGLNPRSYSKNLLQRFRSIIGDEQIDDNHNKSGDNNQIKVVITSDNTQTSSTLVYTLRNDLSQSVCEHTTLSDSQIEKNNLEILSYSCDNVTKPNLEISAVTSRSNSIVSTSRSNSSLNKLPVYMQGSKHLGARIAQSDYIDPTTILNDTKSEMNNVNILINKNSIRPDSLFSNSSFVTTSSESTFAEKKENVVKKFKQVESAESSVINSDECFYEKSFEKIEQITDEDVFRDSAVYSDQDDEEKSENKTIVKDTVKIEENTRRSDNPVKKSKVAPPVPAKPKITNIPILADKTKITTVKRNYRQSFARSESAPINETDKLKPSSSIQMKRLSFERTSLDSVTRKKLQSEVKRSSTEIPKVTKSVLERRLEIESMTKMQTTKIVHKTNLCKPKSITSKMATFGQTEIPDIPKRNEPKDCEAKESWVKQVVNKFQ